VLAWPNIGAVSVIKQAAASGERASGRERTASAAAASHTQRGALLMCSPLSAAAEGRGTSTAPGHTAAGATHFHVILHKRATV